MVEAKVEGAASAIEFSSCTAAVGDRSGGRTSVLSTSSGFVSCRLGYLPNRGCDGLARRSRLGFCDELMDPSTPRLFGLLNLSKKAAGLLGDFGSEDELSLAFFFLAAASAASFDVRGASLEEPPRRPLQGYIGSTDIRACRV